MRAKIPKCKCLALKSSSGKLVDPQLSLSGQQVPFASEQVKFLGRIFEIPRDTARIKESISFRLQTMLHSVDFCPLTRSQKLKMYRAGVCPRLSWLLTIDDLPISWIEKKLDAIYTLYLKKWVGLAKPANPSVLYLPPKIDGLNLPLISTLYKRLQVVRQSQLLTSPDTCVRYMAEKSLQNDLTLQRSKFKANVIEM